MTIVRKGQVFRTEVNFLSGKNESRFEVTVVAELVIHSEDMIHLERCVTKEHPDPGK